MPQSESRKGEMALGVFRQPGVRCVLLCSSAGNPTNRRCVVLLEHMHRSLLLNWTSRPNALGRGDSGLIALEQDQYIYSLSRLFGQTNALIGLSLFLLSCQREFSRSHDLDLLS